MRSQMDQSVMSYKLDIEDNHKKGIHEKMKTNNMYLMTLMDGVDTQGK